MTTNFPFTDSPHSVRAETASNSFHLAHRRKRDRAWEKRHLDQKVVYRGVETSLVVKIRKLAAVLHLSEGMVANSILEHAVRAYEDGYLTLYPRFHPKRARRTLHPVSQNHRKPDMKHKSNNPPQTSWRLITTWRNFSPELKRTISALASEEDLNVPTGELVSALLRYGLNAHAAGLLKLEAEERAAALSLLEEAKQ